MRTGLRLLIACAWLATCGQAFGFTLNFDPSQVVKIVPQSAGAELLLNELGLFGVTLTPLGGSNFRADFGSGTIGIAKLDDIVYDLIAPTGLTTDYEDFGSVLDQIGVQSGELFMREQGTGMYRLSFEWTHTNVIRDMSGNAESLHVPELETLTLRTGSGTPGNFILDGTVYENDTDILLVATEVPEPGTIALFASAVAGFVLARRRRRRDS